MRDIDKEIAEAEARLAKVEARLAELKAEKEKRKSICKMKVGDYYWHITTEGSAGQYQFIGSDIDYKLIAIGNTFRTREDAEFEIERLKVLAELKSLSIESGENNNPWDGDTKHYCLNYSHVADIIDTDWWTSDDYGTIYFATDEAAINAIKVVGKERLKKYYFGIKDNKKGVTGNE